jgi:hypothetical protein
MIHHERKYPIHFKSFKIVVCKLNDIIDNHFNRSWKNDFTSLSLEVDVAGVLRGLEAAFDEGVGAVTPVIVAEAS